MATQKVLALVGPNITEYTAPSVSTGAGSAGQLLALNGSGQIDVSVLPTGIGPDVQIVTASEALSAGAFVNIYSGGVRNADGTQTGKDANGFVLAAVAANAQATVYLSGSINTAVSGMTPGPVYLSDTAVGQASATYATTAGHVYQRLGTAVSATAIQFSPGPAITRS